MGAMNVLGNENVGDKGIKCERLNVFSYPAHQHAQYELTLYNKFDGQITVNGLPVFVEEATAILMTPYYTHEIEIDNPGNNPAECVKIAFNGNIFTDTILPKSPIVLKNITDGFIKSAFAEVLKNDDITVRKAVLSAVLAVMSSDKRAVVYPIKKASPHILKTIDFINENFRQSISLTQISDIVGLTPQYLSSLFKSEMKIGINEYISRSRLLYAEELLKNTKMSVTEICYECGYGNYSHFLRMFHNLYGISPNTLRKKTRDE